MNLNSRSYAEFKVSDLFIVKYGVNLELNACSECERDDADAVNFVARTAENNGVSAYVSMIDDVKPQRPGLISVAGGGSVLSTFLQNEPFYSGRDLYTLEAKDCISDEAKMFIITVLEQNKYKYSYGRQANKTLPDILLKLPIDDEGRPDYQFMEDYIKSLHHKPLTTKNRPGMAPDLDLHSWKRFYLGRIFDIRKGKRLTAEDQEDGENIYIGAIDSNNGVANYIAQAPIHAGNTISLSYNGSVGEAFYQPEPYWATDDVNALYSKYDGFNVYIGLFLAATIRQEKYRFSYGRKWTLDNMKATDICLPIQYGSDGFPVIDETHKYSDAGFIPDWQFMENYIKALPYGDRI